MSIKQCISCRWHEPCKFHERDHYCVNPASEFAGDYTECGHSCKAWESQAPHEVILGKGG